jgi:methionyl-tRNA formyltransferase
MKIVFFGTPDYVVPVLERLSKAFRSRSGESSIATVVTQAPKPVGRKQLLEYSAVDTWAYKKKVQILFKPIDLVKNQLRADLGVLAAFGEIIPEEVIELFPYGILNIHPSLLPAWRGASPIQAAIISGEKTTGVSIIKLDEKLDHGAVVSQFKDEITDADTADSLRQRLFQRSANVMPKLIEAYLAGKITTKKQNDEAATYTRQLKKDDAFIPPEYLNSALTGSDPVSKGWDIAFIKNYSLKPDTPTLERFIRAMQPWPISWTNINLNIKTQNSKLFRLKILKAHLEELKVNRQMPLVLDEVQLEGKSAVSWKQFLEGYPKAKFTK